ncbi:MAG: protoheme IX farnesyltransferase [Candidatus Hydrogenedentota bacterium]
MAIETPPFFAQAALRLKSIPFRAYMEMTKPRIVTMVLITAGLGYFLGGMGLHSLEGLFFLLLGVSMTSSGAGVLNQYLEREFDAKMRRTKNRPIPSGAISPIHALLFGEYLVLGGTFVLLIKINALTAFLALLTTFLYVLVYTPMKRYSWLNTLIGAVPGALPPMGGWTAATGHLDPGAWALFAILFIWQMPHFYSIAWLFREDYAEAGFKMLPCEDPTGRRTFRQTVFFAALLIPISLIPAVIHLSGPLYAAGAVALGLWFLSASYSLMRTGTHAGARRVLKVSVMYLPALLGLIVLDFSLSSFSWVGAL